MTTAARLTSLLALAATLVCAPLATAATPTPAHWSVQQTSRKAPAPGAVFTLTLTARIDPGWHLYALEEPDGGPLPTVIGLAEGDPLTLLDVSEPEPHRVPDPATHTLSGMFQDTVGFTLKLRAPRIKPASDAVSHILVRYQTCNDQACLPPRTESVAVPLGPLLR